LRPVRHFELHFTDVMAASGIMFVRHAGSINLFSIRPHRCKMLKFDPCTNSELLPNFSTL
ncbi:hypothetical protein QNN85_33640, partial [Agrobacterium rhizogenes]|nr:hypothetical protein [Rhizobium rhizogenes]